MIKQDSKISIVGCGGLGSNVASCLVRAKFRNLSIIDFDIVSESNLDRQFFFFDQIGELKTESLKVNLLRIHRDINIYDICKRIDKSNIDNILSEADVIFECVDNASVKKMIVEYALTKNKLVIAASGVSETCVEYPIHVKKMSSNFYLIGDNTTDIRTGQRPYSAKVSVCAGYQADIAISLMLKHNL